MYKNLAAALAAACFISPVFSQGTEPLKIGFGYVAPLAPTGWVHQHDEGRKAVVAALGNRVKTTRASQSSKPSTLSWTATAMSNGARHRYQTFIKRGMPKEDAFFAVLDHFNEQHWLDRDRYHERIKQLEGQLQQNGTTAGGVNG